MQLGVFEYAPRFWKYPFSAPGGLANPPDLAIRLEQNQVALEDLPR